MTTGQRPTEHVVTVQGRPRRSLMTVPESPAGAPLVLVLHGSNQKPETIRRFTDPGFDTLATRFGAVVAYPEGFKKHWNDARASSDFAARAEGYDDVAFLRALIDDAHARLDIDLSRVYAIGFSNGGQIVTRLAHEIPESLAGIALIGATQPAPENFAPDHDHELPLPVLLIHGTKDPNVPYDGGMASLFGFRPRGLGLSAPQTAAYWALRNGIAAPPARLPLPRLPRDVTRVDRLDYTQDGKAPVRLYTVHGGGHVIPGNKKAPRIMGRTSRGIRTAEEIADFFALRAAMPQHERPTPPA
ncbi:MAG: PHB depolymerase family esterase [Microbacterium sp.]